MVYRYLNPLSPTERDVANQRNYSDFRKLNGILIRLYNLEDKIQTLNDIEIEEINPVFLPNLIELVHKYFKYNPNLANEPLELWSVDAIIQYIREAVDRSFGELTDTFIDQAAD
jgi:hypothetical protein